MDATSSTTTRTTSVDPRLLQKYYPIQKEIYRITLRVKTALECMSDDVAALDQLWGPKLSLECLQWLELREQCWNLGVGPIAPAILASLDCECATALQQDLTFMMTHEHLVRIHKQDPRIVPGCNVWSCKVSAPILANITLGTNLWWAEYAVNLEVFCPTPPPIARFAHIPPSSLAASSLWSNLIPPRTPSFKFDLKQFAPSPNETEITGHAAVLLPVSAKGKGKGKGKEKETIEKETSPLASEADSLMDTEDGAETEGSRKRGPHSDVSADCKKLEDPEELVAEGGEEEAEEPTKKKRRLIGDNTCAFEIPCDLCKKRNKPCHPQAGPLAIVCYLCATQKAQCSFTQVPKPDRRKAVILPYPFNPKMLGPIYPIPPLTSGITPSDETPTDPASSSTVTASGWPQRLTTASKKKQDIDSQKKALSPPTTRSHKAKLVKSCVIISNDKHKTPKKSAPASDPTGPPKVTASSGSPYVIEVPYAHPISFPQRFGNEVSQKSETGSPAPSQPMAPVTIESLAVDVARLNVDLSNLNGVVDAVRMHNEDLQTWVTNFINQRDEYLAQIKANAIAGTNEAMQAVASHMNQLHEFMQSIDTRYWELLSTLGLTSAAGPSASSADPVGGRII
ncbi:hypothetical protein JAAARDRAFT_198991 [Jaapia argillacea MUCL 33604]|uniref:Zn(2)-C6 fungal-type domain-containing protein n=1 Tax=Jaapia argillacea MUCL 33604 TaxID=933084 RepID=A0A067PMH3_9AGAM|nr:hypothetical protein JAAARDRAFT_198991 [Jaapia argillacea MUCL 33604]